MCARLHLRKVSKESTGKVISSPVSLPVLLKGRVADVGTEVVGGSGTLVEELLHQFGAEEVEVDSLVVKGVQMGLLLVLFLHSAAEVA